MMQPQTFAERMIGMMKDYNITLFDALLWDFESYYVDATKIYSTHGIRTLENTFIQYLEENGALAGEKSFYTEIFMGRSENMELKDAKEKK